jgi:D-glycero-D-manno-heptose 1,7-bisphosphate phosphatase
MKLIILDRDGVINEDSDAFIKCPEEWVPIPGSLEAIARFNQAGYQVMVASNQSGIARGLFDMDMLMRIHEKMHHQLSLVGGNIDAVFFCPHGPDDECDCRKPKPGLFYQIHHRTNTPLDQVPAVGDSLRDLQAAQSAGAKPVLVKTGKGIRTLDKGEGLEGIPVYENLATFAHDYLSSI